MARARKAKQLVFSMPNRQGLLSEITEAVSNAKVNISSTCAYEMDNKAYFMVVTENNRKAAKALAGLGVETTQEDVIAVDLSNKPGELHKVAKRLADGGIDIHYTYGTAGAGRTSTIIFKTDDDKKAIRLINK